MTPSEIASYLVALNTLLDAQSKGTHSIPSSILASEYNKYWDLLKEAIIEERKT